MILINLLPVRAAQKKEQLRGQLVILIVSLVVVLIGCAGVYVSLSMKMGSLQQEITRQENESRKLQKTIGEVGHIKKLQKDLQGKLDVLDKLKAGKTGPVHLLDELSRVIPDKCWLTSFKDSGGTISLNGFGLSEDVVAAFMRDLDASPYYRNVELNVIEQTHQGSLTLQKFNITCHVETPPHVSQAQ
jgi:type IV pilus assembly protein PilN